MSVCTVVDWLVSMCPVVVKNIEKATNCTAQRVCLTKPTPVMSLLDWMIMGVLHLMPGVKHPRLF